MNAAIRAATEAAAWAFSGVLLALWLFFYIGRVSVPMEDFAAFATAAGLVGSATGFVAVAVLARFRFPGKSPVLGARRGAGIGVLVVVVVASVSALFTFGSHGLLYSLLAQLGYAVVLAGGPFAVLGAVLGRWMDRRLFSSRGA
jgi:ABC-type sulfate transport system permease subunit